MNSLVTAIDLFLREYAYTHAAKTVGMCRGTLRSFRYALGRDDLAWNPYDVNQFVSSREKGSRVMTRAHLNAFVDWVRERYPEAVVSSAVAPPQRPLRSERLVLKVPDDVASWERLATQIAERLMLPHQRAVFLCGYLYGMSLGRITAVLMDELMALPMRDDIYNLLVGLAEVRGTQEGGFFRPWLGPNRKVAEERWRKWTGGAKPFTVVILLGQYDRRSKGINPGEGVGRDRLTAALPPLTRETVRLLRRWWE